MPLKGAGDGSNKAQKAVVNKKGKSSKVGAAAAAQRRPAASALRARVPSWRLNARARAPRAAHLRIAEQAELDEDDLAFKKKQMEEKKAAAAYLDKGAKKK